jgi:hypothetical protein
MGSSTMSRSETLKRVWAVIAISWREAAGLVAIKLFVVLLASAYRGARGLPPEQLRQALTRFFHIDTAVFLSSLEPVFLILLLSTILTLPFIAVVFGAFAPSARGADGPKAAVLADARVLVLALLACELVAGVASTALAVRIVPEITLGLALKRQALIAAVALVAALPLTAAMVLLRTKLEHRLLLVAAGIGIALVLRYSAAAVPALRWPTQPGIESLLMTGEADRFALGMLLACAWAALFLAAALKVAGRAPARKPRATRVTAVANTAA